MAKNHKKTVNKTALNNVRIIGGQFKRQNIAFIDADGLRPTPDRMRETLFNWLMHDIYDANVLDACAGTGVLGFESLSRGAKHTTFIEANANQAEQLKQTITQLKLTNSQATIINGNAEKVITSLTQQQSNLPYHLVFIDPPYALNLWQPILQHLIANQLINQDTLIYVEANKNLTDIFDAKTLENIAIIKEKVMGQVHAWLVKLSKNDD